MNYAELGSSYTAEAERIKKRIASIRSAPPGTYWEMIERQNTLMLLDDMYIDCLTVGRYLRKRGVSADAKM